MDRITKMVGGNAMMPTVYGVGVFMVLHWSFVIYINAPFLESHVGGTMVGVIFAIGNLLSLLLLLNDVRLVNKLGNYKLALTTVALQFVLTAIFYMMSAGIVATSPLLLALVFILMSAVYPMIGLTLDIFFESFVSNENLTGRLRALFYTILNFFAVISPAIVGFVLGVDQFWRVYLISSLFLIPMFILIAKYLKGYKDNVQDFKSVKSTALKVWKSRDLRSIYIVKMFLNFFYAWVVVYIPIHLLNNIGFNWAEIGVMFTIMLLPFILFEIPVGNIADKKIGEKEMMIMSIILIAITVSVLSFITVQIFWVWALALFMTRVGASILQITADSYFYKHVDGHDSDVIGFYLTTRPVGYTLAPAIAAAMLFLLLPFHYLFLAVGLIMLLALPFAFAIRDTK